MKMNVLNGHESVGIMPQAETPWAVLEPFDALFFTDGRPRPAISRANDAPNW
ncbi:hypothetical protein [Pseudomonas citri]|uniref:hypothetical protein n=1 Tax=Pseudomonas citri TaxID=2978349 RepID=UPI0021B5B052|nr:hypothetical protein [Pseudomonas citri]